MAITARARIQTQLFIDGEFVDSAEGATFATRNPATGEILASVSEAREKDVDRAVHAAQASLRGSWGTMDLKARARAIAAVAELLEERAEQLALLESLDAGKPIRDTRAEVLETADWFRFFADMAQKLRSAVVPAPSGCFNYTLNQPIGVVGLIIPWNYPLPLCGIKIPAALAMGNAVVLKPAEQTP